MEDLSVISCYSSLKLYSYKIKNQQKQQFCQATASFKDELLENEIVCELLTPI